MKKDIHTTRLEILPWYRRGHLGADILITSEQATAEDYCQAFDEYILSGEYYRQRSAVLSCEGCDICCQERIPLTALDVLGRQELPELGLSGFFQRYTYITVSGRVVDIALARNSAGKCIFLDPHTRKCRSYAERPLVCRTYLCTYFSPRLKKLREALVNSGEDELVRLWAAGGKKQGYIIHEADEPDVHVSDWRANSWTGKTSYSQIKLQEIVTPALWEELCQKGEGHV